MTVKSRPGSDDRWRMPLRSLVLAILLAAAPSAAEMYRCEAPDGTVTFTGNASACPGAQRHAPSREVQRVGPDDAAGSGDALGGEAPPPPAKRRASPAPAEDAQAEMWRRKRAEAEFEKRVVDRDLAEYQEMVAWCNRGGDIVLEDRIGVERNYSCADARSEHDRLSGRAAELRDYLSGGLEDECRRDGCLPGWIR